MTKEPMKTAIHSPSRSNTDPGAAYTKTELLLTIAISTVLAALVIAPMTVIRDKSRLKVCVGNLQQVGRAALLFSEDSVVVLSTDASTTCHLLQHRRGLCRYFGADFCR